MAPTTIIPSDSYLSVRYDVNEKTARLFMIKVRKVMSPSDNDPGKTGSSYSGKKKKSDTAELIAENGKVKRIYFMRIEHYSAQCLQYIFVNPISQNKPVVMDEWRRC